MGGRWPSKRGDLLGRFQPLLRNHNNHKGKEAPGWFGWRLGRDFTLGMEKRVRQGRKMAKLRGRNRHRNNGGRGGGCDWHNGAKKARFLIYNDSFCGVGGGGFEGVCGFVDVPRKRNKAGPPRCAIRCRMVRQTL